MKTTDLGFNKERVEDLREEIDKVAAAVAEEVPEIMEKGIVKPISKAWCTPEAVTFFEGVRETVASCGKSITEAFDGFRLSVQSAGERWAYNTGVPESGYPALAPISLVELNLDVSDIKAEQNGNVFISPDEANSIAANILNVESEIKDVLNSLAKKLEVETAFLGGSQAESVQSCFSIVTYEIHRIFGFLSDDENGLKQQIEKAVKKHEEVARSISSEYDSASSSIRGQYF